MQIGSTKRIPRKKSKTQSVQREDERQHRVPRADVHSWIHRSLISRLSVLNVSFVRGEPRGKLATEIIVAEVEIKHSSKCERVR